MGDDSGFDEAFLALWPRCRAAASKIVGPDGDAENVAAEALARALVRWRKVQHLEYRDAWVLRVTINLAIDQVRRRSPGSPVRPLDDDPADATALRIDLIDAAVTLPKRQREAVALRYLVGLSEEEAASAMGVAESTVKEHTQRAMAALRVQLGPQVEEAIVAI